MWVFEFLSQQLTFISIPFDLQTHRAQRASDYDHIMVVDMLVTPEQQRRMLNILYSKFVDTEKHGATAVSALAFPIASHLLNALSFLSFPVFRFVFRFDGSGMGLDYFHKTLQNDPSRSCWSITQTGTEIEWGVFVIIWIGKLLRNLYFCIMFFWLVIIVIDIFVLFPWVCLSDGMFAVIYREISLKAHLNQIKMHWYSIFLSRIEHLQSMNEILLISTGLHLPPRRITSSRKTVCETVLKRTNRVAYRTIVKQTTWYNVREWMLSSFGRTENWKEISCCYS